MVAAMAAHTAQANEDSNSAKKKRNTVWNFTRINLQGNDSLAAAVFDHQGIARMEPLPNLKSYDRPVRGHKNLSAPPA